jgi:hypothetical protein
MRLPNLSPSINRRFAAAGLPGPGRGGLRSRLEPSREVLICTEIGCVNEACDLDIDCTTPCTKCVNKQCQL